MNTLRGIMAVMMMLLLISANAQEKEPKVSRTKGHAFSGTLLLGFEGGATWALTDYDRVKPNSLGKAVLDYYFPTISNSPFDYAT